MMLLQGRHIVVSYCQLRTRVNLVTVVVVRLSSMVNTLVMLRIVESWMVYIMTDG